MRTKREWLVYGIIVVAVLCGLSYLLKDPKLDQDGRACFMMLAGIALYGLYWMVKIPGAINQSYRAHTNPARRVINGKEYFWLTNVVRAVTSLRDSQPETVVACYKKQGYEVVVLEDAWDVWGEERCPELRSVWGRMPDGKFHPHTCAQ